MRAPFLIALLLLGAAPTWAAEEPSGCDKFKWPIERERTALTAPDRARLTSGGALAALPSSGVTLALATPADAKLPTPPECAPKEGTFAGFASIKSPPKAGRTMKCELSASPFVPHVSGTRDNSISIAILPTE